ncbi:MAG: precorrin-2 C(20)-methyltransferase [Hyphomicrobiales bacterium]|nr:precorrin-2 C(20)-methyltransferase [Hyphomicrobiales bacterium]
MAQKTATLYGLGIGPGDPELITLKAHRILAAAPVIAYPATETGDSLARAIAAPHIPPGRTEIVIRTPMVPGRFPAHGVYDAYAAQIAGHLDAGRDVAVLCEGDPFFYGSFMYLHDRLAPAHPTVVVPGVSSLGACAAVAGAPLVSRADVLTVIPGPLDEADMADRLARSDAAAIMKVGRHLDKVRAVVESLGLVDRAWYVEYATMEKQRVLPLRDVPAGAAPYFSMVLVARPGDG